MKRRSKRNNVIDDSEEESDVPDSDNTVTSSNLSSKKKITPKRKRGRPPRSKNKKRQRLQDNSEDDASPPPSPLQNASDQSSILDESENETGSDSAISNYSSDSSSTAHNKKASPKRRQGKPPLARNKKKQRLQDGSDANTSPQPSTSQNAHDQRSPEESENDSGSESADSDYGPVNDRSVLRKKPPSVGRRRPPCRAASTPKKRPNNSVNGVSSQKSILNGTHLSASQKKNAKLSHSNDVSFDSKLVENLAQKLVYFLLIEDQKKYAIRRKAIVTHVFKDDVYTPKLYAAVIKKANTVLKKTFGMELMELENQKDSYLIVNILRRELGIHDYVELPRIKQQQHGLILYLLTVIYMNENVITEDELTRSLKPLGIDLTSKRLHPVFGDVKKYITTELIKQMYLNYECISKEPPKYEFTWGLRAKQEFDKRDLLQFVCQIMGDTSPEDWRIQFRDAEASAKPNADS